MIEALWSVEFVSDVGMYGAGVAVFETGRILGGDSMYTYVDSYKVDRDMVQAEIEVTHYAGQPLSVFGPARQFKLSVTGKADRNAFQVVGNRVDAPDRKIVIQLTRRAELP